MIAIQSLYQLEAVYGRARAHILRDNMETQIYYRPADLDTADFLEHSLGRVSEYAHSHTKRKGTPESSGLLEQAVPVMTAWEIRDGGRRYYRLSPVSSVVIIDSGYKSQMIDYPMPLPTTYTSQNPSGGAGWLPAAETWTYASSDAPTYTLTISGDKTAKYYPGERITLSQSTGGTKYFLVTKAAYSAPNTTLTLYGGTDDNTNRAQTNATQNQWYNLGSISINIPIGPSQTALAAGNDIQSFAPTAGPPRSVADSILSQRHPFLSARALPAVSKTTVFESRRSLGFRSLSCGRWRI